MPPHLPTPGPALCSAAAILLLLLAGCAEDPVEPAPEGETARTWDLRPRWTTDETYSVREELKHLKGTGPFPGAAEIENRAESTDRNVDIYDVRVIAAEESRLTAVERTYRNSVHTVDGALVPTVVSGRKYSIEEPLGAIRIRRVEEDGTEAKLLPEEQPHVARFGLRLAASLVPGVMVPEGATWRPGRSMEALAIRGGKGARMVARLDRVEEEGGRRIAVVMAETDSRIMGEGNVELSLVIRETLRIDIDRARLESYRSVTDRRYPAYRGQPKKWRRTILTVTVTGE